MSEKQADIDRTEVWEVCFVADDDKITIVTVVAEGRDQAIVKAAYGSPAVAAPKKVLVRPFRS